VVIALIVTPEGLPLAYEVLPGNTADRTTLRAFLQQIQSRYGQAERIWIMDRGIPTEEVLAEMRTADPPIHYLVGTPKGRLSQYEQRLLEVDWQKVREGVEVKLSPENGELYVLARSGDRVHKERAMRRRQLKKLWKRLGELQRMKLPRDRLMLKLGGAFQQAPVAVRLVRVQTPPGGGLRFELLKDRLRQVRLREGRYLLRTNLTETDPARLWNLYMQLSRVEEAFRNLKGDLAVRPVYHQKEERIEAHIFVAFLAYCLHATLTQRLRVHAGGLTPRSILEQLKGILMLDVEVPTTDGRWLHMSRYTQPDAVQRLLLAQLRMPLPAQPPPRITQERSTSTASCSEDLLQ
jgi:transposase